MASLQPTNSSSIHRNILQIKSRIQALNFAAYKLYSPYMYVGNLDTALGHNLLPELKRLIPFGKRYIMFKSYCIIEFNTNVEALTECNTLNSLQLNGRILILNVLLNNQIDQFLTATKIVESVHNENGSSTTQNLPQQQIEQDKETPRTFDTDSISTISLDSTSVEQNNQMMSKVFIGNFPYETKEIDLHNLVKWFGPIWEIVVLRRKDGSSCGAGFIKFHNSNDAEKCVNVLNHTSFNGRKLNLKLEKSS